MLRSFFATAFRNLLKNKSFSLINILGLSIGMASAILLLLWIVKEISYDKFHSKKDRIYMFYNHMKEGGEIITRNATPSLLAPYIQSNFPQVEMVFRYNVFSAFIVSANDKHLEGIALVTDPGFLTTFDFPLIKGNPQTALSSPRSIVLTQQMARKFFGDEDAMGKPVSIDSNKNFIVTGIMKDLPPDTDFGFDYLLPFTYKGELRWDVKEWKDFAVSTCVLLKPGISEQTADNLFADVIKKNAPELECKLFLHPLEKWHLYRWFDNGRPRGMIEMVRLFHHTGDIHFTDSLHKLYEPEYRQI